MKPAPKKSDRRPPPPSLLDRRFQYIPSNSTDVAATFARHGFVPPSTLKEKQA